jgi:Fe-S-cluster containining protein
MSGLQNRSYFFDDGLRFECQRCGACCDGAPGLVWVDAAEADAIVAFFVAAAAESAEDFLRPHGRGFAIRERADGRCWFYDQGCRIYPLRPMQCRIYPFWLTNLRSQHRWQAAARQCPGIGKGRLYTRQEILDSVALDRRLCQMADFTA